MVSVCLLWVCLCVGSPVCVRCRSNAYLWMVWYMYQYTACLEPDEQEAMKIVSLRNPVHKTSAGTLGFILRIHGKLDFLSDSVKLWPQQAFARHRKWNPRLHKREPSTELAVQLKLIRVARRGGRLLYKPDKQYAALQERARQLRSTPPW